MKLFLSLALFAAFLLCPTACADGVREGLSLAAVQALPALFPFFVVSGLLVRCRYRAAVTAAGKAACPLIRPAARGCACTGARTHRRVSGRRRDRMWALLSEGVLSREAAERA